MSLSVLAIGKMLIPPKAAQVYRQSEQVIWVKENSSPPAQPPKVAQTKTKQVLHTEGKPTAEVLYWNANSPNRQAAEINRFAFVAPKAWAHRDKNGKLTNNGADFEIHPNHLVNIGSLCKFSTWDNSRRGYGNPSNGVVKSYFDGTYSCAIPKKP